MMDKETKQNIKNLKKEKNFDKIYELYGVEVFRKNVSDSFRKQELKKLSKAGKYEDIFVKYGKKYHNKYLAQARQREIELETGSKLKGISFRVTNFFKKQILPIFLSSSIALTATPALLSEMQFRENAEKYEVELNEYQNRINNYAKQFQNLNLSKLEIMMKVMDDMWNNIQGYGKAEKDIFGFGRLAFAEDNGIGVCRHMADDTSNKLNAIDSSFNARNVAVYLDSGSRYVLANINRTVVEDNETVVGDDSNNTTSENVQKIATKIFGNHMVVAVDIPEENLTLILDPTNPGIGIYRNGSITMFNSSKEDGLTLNKTVYGEIFAQGLGVIDSLLDTLSSFLKSGKSFDELNELYGVEAQNAALDKVRSLSSTRAQDSCFDDRIKIDNVPGVDSISQISNDTSGLENTEEDITR